VTEERVPANGRTPPIVSILRTVLDTLNHLRSHHRRRLPFLSPPLERRRPRIAAEDYAARHSIQHTLDRKAELRRLVPSWPEAADRYHQLLVYELAGLRDVVAALQSTSGGRDLQESIAENRSEIERLEVEIAWCAALKAKHPPPAAE
jgi:hypothetical protein